jgi:GntR family transcriptional repressor for pyruvate dehydrogenase complex
MLDPREHHEYLELMEARSLIENELVRLARERANEEEIARLLEVVEEMQAARKDVQAFMDADLRFHITLAEAAHNGTLLRTMLAIRGPLRRFIWSRATRQIQDNGSLDQAVADHRIVAQSIAGGSIDDGDVAMERIVSRGKAHVLESIEQENSPGGRSRNRNAGG